MNALLLYLLVALLIALLGILVVYNFLRYRFTGDNTFIFLTLLVVAFIGSMIFTIAQYTPGPLTPAQASF